MKVDTGLYVDIKEENSRRVLGKSTENNGLYYNSFDIYNHL